MANLKNVVIINDFDYINGGAAKVALNTAEILNKVGINVYFFSAVHKEKKCTSNIKYITTNQKEALKDNIKLRGILNGIYNIKAKKELLKLLDTLDKENTIIHVHGWMKALSSSIFSAICKKKFTYVVTFHDYFSICPNGGFFNYKKNQICRLEPLSLECLICNCDSRNYIFKIYRIIRQFVQNNIININDKIKYIISISDFSYRILKNSIRKDAIVKHIDNPIEIEKKDIIKVKNNSYYLYVGRVSKEKGVELFCEAITKLNYKGIVVGDGNQMEYLKKKYKNIEFVGWKSKEETCGYMKNARVLIFPSLWYEGAPLTVLEAMAIGLPCIVSNCSAAIENIEDSKNGLIFNPKETEDLINKIKKCSDDKFISKLSQNCYDDYWKRPHDKKEYLKELLEFYNLIIDC